MFVTKKHLPRRTFLRGMGVSLALPLLDSMIPARTLLAQTAARPVTTLSWFRNGSSGLRMGENSKPAPSVAGVHAFITAPCGK